VEDVEQNQDVTQSKAQEEWGLFSGIKMGVNRKQDIIEMVLDTGASVTLILKEIWKKKSQIRS